MIHQISIYTCYLYSWTLSKIHYTVMSTHLLPALFSCRKHHGICGYVASILDQKGVRTSGVSYLNIPCKNLWMVGVFTYIEWFDFLWYVGIFFLYMDGMGLWYIESTHIPTGCRVSRGPRFFDGQKVVPPLPVAKWRFIWWIHYLHNNSWWLESWAYQICVQT